MSKSELTFDPLFNKPRYRVNYDGIYSSIVRDDDSDQNFSEAKKELRDWVQENISNWKDTLKRLQETKKYNVDQKYKEDE